MPTGCGAIHQWVVHVTVYDQGCLISQPSSGTRCLDDCIMTLDCLLPVLISVAEMVRGYYAYVLQHWVACLGLLLVQHAGACDMIVYFLR